MYIIKSKTFFCICLLLSMGLTVCVSNNANKKEQPSIVGNWQLTEIASVTGLVEKAPALTAYNFYKDSTYIFYYLPEEQDTIKYSGTYTLSTAGKTLMTNYTLKDINTKDTAYILQLTDSLMILKEIREKGDTIKFKKMTEVLKK